MSEVRYGTETFRQREAFAYEQKMRIVNLRNEEYGMTSVTLSRQKHL